MGSTLRTAGRRMTTVIAGLVIASIILSVGAVSSAIFITLQGQSLEAGRVQQQTNLRVAATVLERSFTNVRLIWSEGGGLDAFKMFSFPNITNNEPVEAVANVTGQDVSVYEFDPETGDLVARASSLLGTMGEAIDLSDVRLAATSPATSALAEGATYVGELSMLGTRYYGALLPMTNLKGDLLGAIHVMTPTAAIEAGANAVWLPIALAGGTAIVLLGLAGLVVSRRITSPIPRLAEVMRKIADGDYETDVPYSEGRNEIGEMARAVEVLRESAIRVSRMTEAEADRVLAEEDRRKAMMAELQAAFGVVVDAALDGDFSRRVDSHFSDRELNALAESINELVDGFARGMDEVLPVLAGMAQADLTGRVTGNYRGAFAELKTSVNGLADTFGDIIGDLKTASNQLKSATGEIMAGANDLSERTTRQAATIEEASASMEQLASMVVENAERANEASHNAATVTETATRSGDTMKAADEAMERIRASSAKISNIIGLIDDIAFQTNLLALNASVEAARAGDAGRGFAVVAVEVRRLAQSAAQASSEVKTLIEQASTEVGAGSRLVDDATKGIETMRDAAHANQTLLDAIALSGREQANSIEEMNAAVRELDEMTQRNAALVEETNAAIEQTSGQATALDGIVGVFSVAGQPAMDMPASGRSNERPAFDDDDVLESDWTPAPASIGRRA